MIEGSGSRRPKNIRIRRIRIRIRNTDGKDERMLTVSLYLRAGPFVYWLAWAAGALHACAPCSPPCRTARPQGTQPPGTGTPWSCKKNIIYGWTARYIGRQLWLPFSEKKLPYSAEYGLGKNSDAFHQNSVCFAAWKILWIPFLSIWQKIK